MPYTVSIAPLASGVQSASGVTTAVDLGGATSVRLRLDATAGTGTLVASLETAPTSTGPVWRTVDAFTSIGGPASEERGFYGLDRHVRVRWALTGGPFTFGLSGDSLRVYCTPSDMKAILQERTLVKDQNVGYTDGDLDRFAQEATDEIDGSLGAVYTLPLSAWRNDLRRKTAELATFYAMRKRGFNPNDTSGIVLLSMESSVQKWLQLVRRQEIELQGVVDSTPDVEDGGAYVVTSAPRGWGLR